MSTIVINVFPSEPYYRGTKVLDGNTYEMLIKWNTFTEVWYMNIKGKNNTVDIKGIALLPGKDLFERYGEYQLGNLWVIDNSGKNEDPTFDEFGSRWTLEYTTVD